MISSRARWIFKTKYIIVTKKGFIYVMDTNLFAGCDHSPHSWTIMIASWSPGTSVGAVILFWKGMISCIRFKDIIV
jgi:hypothetical protein